MKLFITIFAAILAAAAVIGVVQHRINESRKNDEIRAPQVAQAIENLAATRHDIDIAIIQTQSQTSMGDRRVGVKTLATIKTKLDDLVSHADPEIKSEVIAVQKYLGEQIAAHPPL